MTLTAGFHCTDGFVIAADTELTLPSVRIQGHKLMTSRLDEPFSFCLAFAGDVPYALAAGQQIREAVRALRPPSCANIRRAIEETLEVFYERHMRHNWTAMGTEQPVFQFIIGFQGHESPGDFGVVATSNEAVHDVETAWFHGTGWEVASYVSERLFDGRNQSTAITHHLVQQLFREVKRTGPGVGGNTEIFSRRCLASAEPFFMLPSVAREDRPFWGLEDDLWSAVRNALTASRVALRDHTVAPLLEKRLRRLRKKLTTLYKDCHEESNMQSADVTQLYTTEYGTPIGHPWKDLE
jgi:hypothetical protein